MGFGNVGGGRVVTQSRVNNVEGFHSVHLRELKLSFRLCGSQILVKALFVDHQVVVVPPGEDGVHFEQVAVVDHLRESVHQHPPHFDQLRSGHQLVPVLNVRRLVSKTGHLEKFQRVRGVTGLHLVTQALVVESDVHLLMPAPPLLGQVGLQGNVVELNGNLGRVKVLL